MDPMGFIFGVGSHQGVKQILRIHAGSDPLMGTWWFWDCKGIHFFWEVYLGDLESQDTNPNHQVTSFDYRNILP